MLVPEHSNAMAKRADNSKSLYDEIDELQRRLEEAEETLRAIRQGEVDALVIEGPKGEVIYTVTSADYPYRLMIDEMNEGAVSVSPDAFILYNNRNFANILGFSDNASGVPFGDYIVPEIVGPSSLILGQVVYIQQGTAGNIPLAAAFAVVPIVVMGILLTIAKRIGAFDAL